MSKPRKPRRKKTAAEPAMGALVMYCGHAGYFLADIYRVGNVNVVRANGPVTGSNITRVDLNRATHQLMDFPAAGFWKPELGVFVVPAGQVYPLAGGAR